MRVSFNVSELFRARWYEYVVRFFFGGLITLCAGLIAKHFGPAVGGLFLGFPAIFPATATLVEKHQAEKKKRAGIEGTMRGRQAAAVDAMGAAMASIGLAGFGLIVWQVLPTMRTSFAFLSATALWFVVSVLVWHMRKARPRRREQDHPRQARQQTGAREFERRT